MCVLREKEFLFYSRLFLFYSVVLRDVNGAVKRVFDEIELSGAELSE